MKDNAYSTKNDTKALTTRVVIKALTARDAESYSTKTKTRQKKTVGTNLSIEALNPIWDDKSIARTRALESP